MNSPYGRELTSLVGVLSSAGHVSAVQQLNELLIKSDFSQGKDTEHAAFWLDNENIFRLKPSVQCCENCRGISCVS